MQKDAFKQMTGLLKILASRGYTWMLVGRYELAPATLAISGAGVEEFDVKQEELEKVALEHPV